MPPWLQAAWLVRQKILPKKALRFRRLCAEVLVGFWLTISLSPHGVEKKEKKLSEQNKKLQRLLAQQRAIEAEIQAYQEKERELKEKAVARLIHRHKLHRFDPDKIDQGLARLVAELDAGPAHGG